MPQTQRPARPALGHPQVDAVRSLFENTENETSEVQIQPIGADGIFQEKADRWSHDETGALQHFLIRGKVAVQDGNIVDVEKIVARCFVCRGYAIRIVRCSVCRITLCDRCICELQSPGGIQTLCPKHFIEGRYHLNLWQMEAKRKV